tara:strand:+ start:75 stop:371 length:297 start_codon:yes stop_codon:yes gene_type:complete
MPTIYFIKKARIEEIIDVFLLRGYKEFLSSECKEPLKINLLSPGKDSKIVSIINIMDNEGILHYECDLDSDEFERFINCRVVDLNKLDMSNEMSTQTD